MNDHWTEPTSDNVRSACTEFDGWKDNPDPALVRLFKTFPENLKFEDVFLKVTALNATYSTQIRAVSDRTPTIYDVARHIIGLKIDDSLQLGSPEIVHKIAYIPVGNSKHQFVYSFATKYCSWHQPDLYPIWDSRVDEYLWQLRGREANRADGLRQFKRKELWKYPTFKHVVTEFRDHFRLNDFSFKEIDKFLFVEGGKLFARANARPVDEDSGEAVDKPWSEDGYDSEQEREESKKRFTDNEGWHVVRPKPEEELS
ncbi:MAG: hypothetical protein ACRD19_15555 [Terriglobia bacterium]